MDEQNRGSVLVVDEWPDEASFLGFYEAAGPDIGALMGPRAAESRRQ